MIFPATASGSPTTSAPCGLTWASNCGPRRRRPAALLANPAERIAVRRPEDFARRLVGVGKETDVVDADRQFFRRVARLPAGLAIKLGELAERPRLSADDGQHKRQAEATARMTDCGVPPAPIQTGSGFCSGRG